MSEKIKKSLDLKQYLTKDDKESKSIRMDQADGTTLLISKVLGKLYKTELNQHGRALFFLGKGSTEISPEELEQILPKND